MKVGLSTATFFGKILTENALEQISSMGVDIAEVFLTTFSEYEEDFIDLVKSRMSGVEAYSVHSLNNHYEPELFNIVERTRRDGERLFDKVCQGAKKLGAHYYTFHGPSRLKVTEYRLDYQRIGDRLEELTGRAMQHGVKISYENVSWAFYNSPGFFQKLKCYSQSITGCLDIKQAMQAFRNMECITGDRAFTDKEIARLEDYTYEYLEDMGSSLVNVHLSDYNAYGKLMPPGQGIFDYNKLIDRLNRIDYKGPLLIELYSRDYDDYDELNKSLEYIKQLLWRKQ